MAKLWRVFPWNEDAEPGERFSVSHIPPNQGSGRFDLASTLVLYLAENPEHAIAERIARYRGVRLAPHHLREWGQGLAKVTVTIADDDFRAVIDLCEPARLAEYGFRADQPAFRDRTTTRGIAETLFGQGAPGLRWWSSFFGEWHSVVLFLDRVPVQSLSLGTPTFLGLDDSDLLAAADVIGMRV